ncbi:MAG TPA: hypothetical protein VG944_09485 [Fimbriimonas sp.]|nr:hypothetical protein [Fimbriimonas sp.]
MQKFDENNALFVSLLKQESIGDISDQARKIGWDSEDIAGLSVFRDGLILINKGDRDGAAATFRRLLESKNGYLRLHAQIHYSVQTIKPSYLLTTEAEALLRKLGQGLGEDLNLEPFASITWLCLITRLSFALHNVMHAPVRLEEVSPPLYKALSILSQKKVDNALTADVEWVISCCQWCNDPNLRAKSKEVAGIYGVNLF